MKVIEPVDSVTGTAKKRIWFPPGGMNIITITMALLFSLKFSIHMVGIHI